MEELEQVVCDVPAVWVFFVIRDLDAIESPDVLAGYMRGHNKANRIRAAWNTYSEMHAKAGNWLEMGVSRVPLDARHERCAAAGLPVREWPDVAHAFSPQEHA